MVPAIFHRRSAPSRSSSNEGARLRALALHIYIKSTVMFLAFVHPSLPARRPQEIGALSVAGHHSLQTLQHDTRNFHCRGRRTRPRHVSVKLSRYIPRGFTELYCGPVQLSVPLSRSTGPFSRPVCWILNDDLQIYAIGVTALWVYDYLLTLEDEVAYAWKTKNMLSR